MPNPQKDFERLEKRFFDEWVRRNPLLGTSLGIHDPYDNMMPDGTPQKAEDDLKFLKQSRENFEAINPKGLTPARQVDRDLALHTLALWIYERDVLKYGEINPEAPHIVGLALFQILSRNYAPLKERLRSIMKRIAKLPAYIKQARFRMKTPVRQFIESELETLSRLPGFFNMIKDIGRDNMAISAERVVARAVDDVQTALDEYENWLIVDAKPFYRDDWQIGEEKLRKIFELRGIDEAPSTVLRNAEAEMGRLREKLREIGHTIKRKVLIEDIRDLLRQQHAETFDGVLRSVRESVHKAKQFVSRSKFAPLPDHDQLYVTETPQFLCQILPWGTYGGPARFEAKHEGYFYVTPGDCDSDKLKEHNFAALSNLVIHQSYPGHHLMSMWFTRNASLTRILFAQSPETREGWAHYCEERVREMGFDDTPPHRFMMTLGQMYRAVRTVMDIKLATGKMTYDEGTDYLIDHIGMDRVAAESELRRYIANPGMQVCDFVGKERIKELKKWTRELMGKRFTETFFHHQVAICGPLPPKLLKRELEWRIEEELKKPPPKDDEKKPWKKGPRVVKEAAPVKPVAKPAVAAKTAPKSAKPPKQQSVSKSKPKARPKKAKISPKRKPTKKKSR